MGLYDVSFCGLLLGFGMGIILQIFQLWGTWIWLRLMLYLYVYMVCYVICFTSSSNMPVIIFAVVNDKEKDMQSSSFAIHTEETYSRYRLFNIQIIIGF